VDDTDPFLGESDDRVAIFIFHLLFSTKHYFQKEHSSVSCDPIRETREKREKDNSRIDSRMT